MRNRVLAMQRQPRTTLDLLYFRLGLLEKVYYFVDLECFL
jgi:hypothetical protein